MILIADSGSTKTSWYYSKGSNHSEYFSTTGINPFFRNTEDIVSELKKSLSPIVGSNIVEVYFYGAGIINKEKSEVVKLALKQLFPSAQIEVNGDLLAAARATLGQNRGIACILGTGSNSCFYDGKKIIEHNPPLGFILGDEGSGAVIGRKLVGDYLKGIIPHKLADKFREQFPLNYADFLDRVYKKEKPNKFLAQFVPFLHNNIGDTYCRQLIESSFDEFIQRNVKQYSNYNMHQVSFIGSVAYYFSEQLKLVLNSNNIKLGTILKEPLKELAQFH